MIFYMTINLYWLIIACVLYKSDVSYHAMVIEHETAEWSKSPITDFMAVQQPKCPEGYEMLTDMFPGINSICPRSEEFMTKKP